MTALVQSQPGALATQNASSHPFTCNTCQVAFRSSDLQRTHMQSDWHRYNLKRRVASLPPLTAEIFHEKVLANKASAAATAARASFERRCEPCGKSFYSEGAFVNHVGSQKHRVLTARQRGRGKGGDAGTETESMADSTFSLGEPMEVRSTSTLTADESREMDDGFEDMAEGIKRTALGDANANGAVQPPRAGRPAPSSAAKSRDSPISPEKAQEEEGDGEDEEYTHEADLKQCLFCNYVSPTIDLNLHHMSRQHGFFIPEREFLVDLNGLLTYLSESIQVLHQCLFCHKAVHTASGVQTHMRDRGHCMIAFDTEEEQMEVGEYYDFRSTYSDEESDEEEEGENGGVSLGKKRAAKTTIQNAEGEDVDIENDEEGWESDDSSLSSVPTDEITSVPVDADKSRLHLHRHHSHANSKSHKNADGFHSHAHHTPSAVYHDDYELHLPSGRTAGHRSLKTYYKQNLRNYPTPEERAQQRMIESGRHDSDGSDDEDGSDAETETAAPASSNGRDRGRQLISRANGGLGMVGVSEAKKREARVVEKKERTKAQRAENRYRAGNEKRSNFQKHFRDPLLQ